ncbi:hypothetical protein JD974_12275 [Chromobacterium haemolyticum]|uniref:Uncharacterized protein n=1 Tax=Chromobacterium haemolyticum TaxID=394935 RepID=A0ABS3GNU6_9NEIS|nr:hypothetical protein [Chromobacterium haemolyticum]MBK0415181.1 hypothetical protein [Chromobacterium haemolyticum]MBO0416604.1 hypothetical protein [Chromobacterium haemolyticum]MBO0499820.1 hypothetical protein [Chromobacterium haemolyticum]MDH0342828.1 hypothetical protein [Chromobacterium haemolyticum]QOD84874.1 hypothetical protein IEZ30_10505 [Chromobacterium haemolyticum]
MKQSDAKMLAQTLEQTRRAGQAKAALPKLPAPGALPAKTGAGHGTVSAPTASTGAIAGPLVEKDVSLRQYHAETNMTTSDGLFVIKVQPIKQVTLTDANGKTVVMEYAAP